MEKEQLRRCLICLKVLDIKNYRKACVTLVRKYCTNVVQTTV